MARSNPPDRRDAHQMVTEIHEQIHEIPLIKAVRLEIWRPLHNERHQSISCCVQA